MLSIASLTLTSMTALMTSSLAVVDVSPSATRDDARADALREASGVDVVISAKRTQAVVDDAATFGIECTIDDDACLVKLRHFLKVDALLAFAIDDVNNTLTVAHLADAEALTATRRTLAADVDARATWRSLRKAESAPVEPTTRVGDPDDDVERASVSNDVAHSRIARVEQVAGARDDDERTLPPSAVLAILGGAGAVTCAAAAVLVNIELERQQREALAGRLDLNESGYASLEQALVGLSFAAVTGAIAGSVGGAWYLAEQATSSSPR